MELALCCQRMISYINGKPGVGALHFDPQAHGALAPGARLSSLSSSTDMHAASKCAIGRGRSRPAATTLLNRIAAPTNMRKRPALAASPAPSPHPHPAHTASSMTHAALPPKSLHYRNTRKNDRRAAIVAAGPPAARRRAAAAAPQSCAGPLPWAGASPVPGPQAAAGLRWAPSGRELRQLEAKPSMCSCPRPARAPRLSALSPLRHGPGAGADGSPRAAPGALPALEPPPRLPRPAPSTPGALRLLLPLVRLVVHARHGAARRVLLARPGSVPQRGGGRAAGHRGAACSGGAGGGARSSAGRGWAQQGRPAAKPSAGTGQRLGRAPGTVSTAALCGKCCSNMLRYQ
jgi:hypothetical protein